MRSVSSHVVVQLVSDAHAGLVAAQSIAVDQAASFAPLAEELVPVLLQLAQLEQRARSLARVRHLAASVPGLVPGSCVAPPPAASSAR